MKDFFISYNSADVEWAVWIAWTLEDAGYITVVQAWDFQAGSNFVLEMQRAMSETKHTIAVLSTNYLIALYTQAEWAAALAQDPTGALRRLVPVRVEDCHPKGLLAPIVRIDLTDLDELAAREELLAGVSSKRAKPKTRVAFPKRKSDSPTFPGRQAKNGKVYTSTWRALVVGILLTLLTLSSIAYITWRQLPRDLDGLVVLAEQQGNQVSVIPKGTVTLVDRAEANLQSAKIIDARFTLINIPRNQDSVYLKIKLDSYEEFILRALVPADGEIVIHLSKDTLMVEKIDYSMTLLLDLVRPKTGMVTLENPAQQTEIRDGLFTLFAIPKSQDSLLLAIKLEGYRAFRIKKPLQTFREEIQVASDTLTRERSNDNNGGTDPETPASPPTQLRRVQVTVIIPQRMLGATLSIDDKKWTLNALVTQITVEGKPDHSASYKIGLDKDREQPCEKTRVLRPDDEIYPCLQ